MNYKKISVGAAFLAVTAVIFTASLANANASEKNNSPAAIKSVLKTQETAASKSNAKISKVAAVPKPVAVYSSKAKYGRQEIQNLLQQQKSNVYDITWSPDLTKVLYIKQPGNIYIWKTGESAGKFIKAAEPTTSSFTWSPNSRYFLINVGHMGPGNVTSQMIDVNNLSKVIGNFVSSVSAPIWSPDSKYLALSSEDESHSSTEILIYSLEKKQYKSILKAKENGGPFSVKRWDANGNIYYTENDASKGGIVNKKIKVIEN